MRDCKQTKHMFRTTDVAKGEEARAPPLGFVGPMGQRNPRGVGPYGPTRHA